MHLKIAHKKSNDVKKSSEQNQLKALSIGFTACDE
jgi:hypothetical protein